MHVPGPFAAERAALLDAIAAFPLAALIVNGPDGPIAAHAPLVATEDGACLIGHVARSNPFWSHAEGARALAIFAGPDAYVSPGHYPSKAVHGRVVPTWNYLRIEARGTIALEHDGAALRAIVETASAQMEGGRARPWSVDDAPAGYIAGMVRGIVGVRLAVDRLEGAFKLSQNKDEADRAGAEAGLAGEGRGDVAALMAKARPA